MRESLIDLGINPLVGMSDQLLAGKCLPMNTARDSTMQDSQTVPQDAHRKSARSATVKTMPVETNKAENEQSIRPTAHAQEAQDDYTATLFSAEVCSEPRAANFCPSSWILLTFHECVLKMFC